MNLITFTICGELVILYKKVQDSSMTCQVAQKHLFVKSKK